MGHRAAHRAPTRPRPVSKSPLVAMEDGCDADLPPMSMPGALKDGDSDSDVAFDDLTADMLAPYGVTVEQVSAAIAQVLEEEHALVAAAAAAVASATSPQLQGGKRRYEATTQGPVATAQVIGDAHRLVASAAAAAAAVFLTGSPKSGQKRRRKSSASSANSGKRREGGRKVTKASAAGKRGNPQFKTGGRVMGNFSNHGGGKAGLRKAAHV